MIQIVSVNSVHIMSCLHCLSLCSNICSLSLSFVTSIDVIERAKTYLAAVKSVGAYQDSRGNALVRNEVKAFIESQPGVKVASINNIFVANGT